MNPKRDNIDRYEDAYEFWKIKYISLAQASALFYLDRHLLSRYITEIKNDRIETFNENVFNIIDFENKAYWLGFLFADGSVDNKRSHVELSLKLSDKGHLEKYKKFLDCRLDVKTDNSRCRLTVAHKHFKRTLIKYGCTPRKSLSLKFPAEIKENLIRHFIRGYFDGDGCITNYDNKSKCYTVSKVLGTYEFLSILITHVNKGTNYNFNSTIREEKSNAFNWGTYSKINTTLFLHYLYSNSTTYLDRKYIKYCTNIAVLRSDFQNNNRRISVKPKL